MDPLVTTSWLADRLGDPDLAVLDASYHLPGDGRDAAAEFAAGHLPGARFLDLAGYADPGSELSMMLAPVAHAAPRLGALGLTPDSAVVLYDASPYHSAARAWWMLRRYGFSRVALLDGGLARWRAEGRQLATDATAASPRDAMPALDTAPVRTLADMVANLDSGAEQVVDARSAARFTGAEAETRPGSVAGHIPGSRNLPYKQLFRDNGTWKRGDELRAAFAVAGVDPARPVVATCGSGITAAALVFALHLLGHDAALYDGSWNEWGARADTPKATGAA